VLRTTGSATRAPKLSPVEARALERVSGLLSALEMAAAAEEEPAATEMDMSALMEGGEVAAVAPRAVPIALSAVVFVIWLNCVCAPAVLEPTPVKVRT
jgi:hypothetical protein